MNLTPTLEQFIQRKVGQGAYASVDEVIAASLAMMQVEDDETWSAVVRDQIQQGLESARAGRLHTPEQVSDWMADKKADWLARKEAE